MGDAPNGCRGQGRRAREPQGAGGTMCPGDAGGRGGAPLPALPPALWPPAPLLMEGLSFIIHADKVDLDTISTFQ